MDNRTRINLTPPQLSLYEILEFWQNVDRKPAQGPNGDCWEWKLKREKGGYGHLFIRFPKWRHLKASRFAFYLANDYWPSQLVLHTCDNPPCCNPAHLYEGTHDNNTHDKKDRNRIPRGDDHWMRTKPELVPKGSKRSQTKLTETAVLDIRYQIANGALQIDMAAKYNVSQSLISRVILGQNWTHI